MNLNLKMLMEGVLQTEPGRPPKLSGRLALCRRVDGGIFRVLITPRNSPTYLKTGQTQLRLKLAAPYKTPPDLNYSGEFAGKFFPTLQSSARKVSSKGSLMNDPPA